jgi:DNA-binding CsgD family transcriptional regulator
MSNPPPPAVKQFRTQKARGLRQQLIALLLAEFPRFGGPRMAERGADLLMETIEKCLVAREHLVHGQVLFACYPLNNTPARRQRIEQIPLVPALLDLFSAEEIDALMAGSKPRRQQITDRLVRLCRQAHGQGGLLSDSDLAILTGVPNTTIAALLHAYERTQNVVVPRRATLHDCGSGISHKAVICRQRYLQGKQPHDIARDTFHSPEAVNAYLTRFERVRLCRCKGMNPEETAMALSCSPRLVREYIALEESIELQRKEKNHGPEKPA